MLLLFVPYFQVAIILHWKKMQASRRDEQVVEADVSDQEDEVE